MTARYFHDEPQGAEPARENAALRHLVEGLVGDKHRHRYTSSAHFKLAVDQIAAMLPAWVDGLAAQSDAYEVDHQARLRQMLAGFNVAPYQGGFKP